MTLVVVMLRYETDPQLMDTIRRLESFGFESESDQKHDYYYYFVGGHTKDLRNSDTALIRGLLPTNVIDTVKKLNDVLGVWESPNKSEF